MIVIDASVALKWVFDEEWSAEALALIEADETPIAPILMLTEAGNALWRRTVSGEVTAVEAARLLDGLQALPVGYVDERPLLGEALALATTLKHPIYDCIYLAMAIDHDVTLATADLRFARTLRSRGFGDRLKLIGDES